MFLGIYAVGFVVAVLALVIWFYIQRKRGWTTLLKNLVLLGLGLYAVGMVIAPAPVDIKVGTLARDLLIMAGIGGFFMLLVRKTPVFIIGLLMLLAGLGWYYKNVMKTTFIDQDITLAEQELLVEITEGADVTALTELQDKYDLQISRAFNPQSPGETELDDYYVVDVPAGKRHLLPKIERELYKTGIVDWVEENELLQVDPMPGKLPPGINRKFGINDPGLENLWGFEAMEVDRLYDFLRQNNIKPRKKARVAILDTGVDAAHEDIKGNYVSTKKKHDTDPRGHGTHCAGIAGAVSNNNKGVASFAPDNGFVQITSIRVLSAMGSGSQKMIIDGIVEAADTGADVISMSLGGRSSQSKQRAYDKAIAYANKKGAIVVAAAGNSNRNAKDFAPVNSKNVIGVSAVDPQINRAFFSNEVSEIQYGVAAPGVNIYSTVPGSKYESYNGTSMATPYVAGLLGLMKSLKPDLKTEEAYRILNQTGRDTQKTNETGRLIHPYGAVKMLLGE